MLIYGKTIKPNPQPVPGIEGKNRLKLLGIILVIAKVANIHIEGLQVYGYCQDQLNKLFDSLILSLFVYGLEVW